MLAKMYIDNTVMVLIFKIMSASNNDLLHKKCHLIWEWLGLRKSDLILFIYMHNSADNPQRVDMVKTQF